MVQLEIILKFYLATKKINAFLSSLCQPGVYVLLHITACIYFHLGHVHSVSS